MHRLLLLQQSRNCVLIGIIRACDVRDFLEFFFLTIHTCLVLSNNWNCPDKRFWTLFLINRPSNWF